MSHAGEWRQQASIEAARDDRSFVTASEAESKIVEEARRAGDQAFQFDPNASPAAKAAQAGAVRPFGALAVPERDSGHGRGLG